MSKDPAELTTPEVTDVELAVEQPNAAPVIAATERPKTRFGQLFRSRRAAQFLGYPLNREALPPKLRDHRRLMRRLQRYAADSELGDTTLQFRDAIVRSVVGQSEDQRTGITVALSGVEGGEDARLTSLVLAIALGANTHYRVAHIDGLFDQSYFEALTTVLQLTENTGRVERGGARLRGYFNPNQPNVYFLKNVFDENPLGFFSDKHLKSYLEILKSRFDFTVIGMPPFATDSSNVFLAPEVDRLYLVASAGKTRVHDVDHCMEVAAEANIEITGVVLNEQKAPLWSRLFWRRYFF